MSISRRWRESCHIAAVERYFGREQGQVWIKQLRGMIPSMGANHGCARMGWPIGFPNPVSGRIVVLTDRNIRSSSEQLSRITGYFGKREK